MNYYAQYDIQGAIINVVNAPETTYAINVVYDSLFVNTKGQDPTQYVKNVLKDNKMSKQIDATAVTKLIHQSRDVLFAKIKKTFMQLAVYIILLLAYLYESVYLYVYQNQKELAIRYLHGNSYWKRYGVLYGSDLLFFISACLCGLYFMAMPAAFMIAFCFLFYVFDSLLTYAMIHYQEHKGILTTLKGEE